MRNLLMSGMVMLMSWVLTGSLAAKQDGGDRPTTVGLPVLTYTRLPTTVSVPDGGAVLIGGRVRRIAASPRSSREILNSRNERDRICSVKQHEGFTEYDILYSNRPLTMIVSDTGAIEMIVSRVYTENDFEELRVNHPDIYMHVRGFPTTCNADSTIRLNIEADTKYVFENEDELKEKNPELHVVYLRYVEPDEIEMLVTPRIIIQDEG